tara:strand:- start:588 stop:758 length:171 start_codon:yes stop_codon:yes gene_type:complete
MTIYFIWLVGVIVWNYGVPNATPLEDVVVAVILSFLSMGLKKTIIQKKNKYFGNKK